MTKQVTVINWADPTKSLNFTVHDWLENFLVCEICYHSNSFYCDFPGEDRLDHVHYFIKDIPTKDELERAEKTRKEFAKQ